MAEQKKKVLFTPFAYKQLLAAKRNSIHKRGNSKAETKKYFQKVMNDIKDLSIGKNKAIWSEHSDYFTRARVGKHNAMLFEAKEIIYVVGFIHPEQDARSKLIDQELLLKHLGQNNYEARLKKLLKE